MKVAAVMSYPVRTARKETPLEDVVLMMASNRLSAVPITDENRVLLGVVTLSDLVPRMRNAPASIVPLMSLLDEYVDEASLYETYAEMARRSAADAMQEPLVTVGPDAEIARAARLMAEYRIGFLPVVRANGVLVGILTGIDLASRAMGRGEK
ncbi:MAG: CBS domain-containing protein [Acidobacteria bacterium]|nr:CBS domain-containing protein [Acidobacteriota bacterium]